jgi:hypothetical protein
MHYNVSVCGIFKNISQLNISAVLEPSEPSEPEPEAKRFTAVAPAPQHCLEALPDRQQNLLE